MGDIQLKAGNILAAHPDLDFDPEFGRAVIVLLAVGQATVGVNIASNHINGNLFKGGPLKMAPIALHKAEYSIPSSRPVGNSGYAITELDDYTKASALFSKEPKHLAIVAGYAGWSPGQLEDEMAQGVWQKSTLDLDTLLAAWPKERWKLAAAQIQDSAVPAQTNAAPAQTNTAPAVEATPSKKAKPLAPKGM